ncbi:unnamed protein product [Effrenium voratum]|nr:unnamed protein product [Effrenium voratum]
MNGGLIVGTMDGANIEIREECGEDTMFIFGCLEHEVGRIAAQAQQGNYPIDDRLQAVFQAIRSGTFSQGEPDAQEEFNSIINRLCNIHAAGTWDGDKYLVIHDFPSFVDAQAKVDATYKDKATWCKLSIQAAACMAKFSTDRTISEYAEVIWGLTPARRSMPGGPAEESPKPAPKKVAPQEATPSPDAKAEPKPPKEPEAKPEKAETEKTEKAETAVAPTEAPEKKEAKVAEKVEAKVAEKVEAKVAEKVEAKVAEKVEAKVAEKVEAKVTEKVEAKAKAEKGKKAKSGQ